MPAVVLVTHASIFCIPGGIVCVVENPFDDVVFDPVTFKTIVTVAAVLFVPAISTAVPAALADTATHGPSDLAA